MTAAEELAQINAAITAVTSAGQQTRQSDGTEVRRADLDTLLMRKRELQAVVDAQASGSGGGGGGGSLRYVSIGRRVS
jgi:hypothetical protein